MSQAVGICSIGIVATSLSEWLCVTHRAIGADIDIEVIWDMKLKSNQHRDLKSV